MVRVCASVGSSSVPTLKATHGHACSYSTGRQRQADPTSSLTSQPSQKGKPLFRWETRSQSRKAKSDRRRSSVSSCGLHTGAHSSTYITHTYRPHTQTDSSTYIFHMCTTLVYTFQCIHHTDIHKHTLQCTPPHTYHTYIHKNTHNT